MLLFYSGLVSRFLIFDFFAGNFFRPGSRIVRNRSAAEKKCQGK
jgi:hypothetical protein